MLSVTMYDGLGPTPIAMTARQTASSAMASICASVQDDIAYNMMRMWQGASGLATEDGIVSPAYVVVRPKKMIDSLFASYCVQVRTDDLSVLGLFLLASSNDRVSPGPLPKGVFTADWLNRQIELPQCANSGGLRKCSQISTAPSKLPTP